MWWLISQCPSCYMSFSVVCLTPGWTLFWNLHELAVVLFIEFVVAVKEAHCALSVWIEFWRPQRIFLRICLPNSCHLLGTFPVFLAFWVTVHKSLPTCRPVEKSVMSVKESVPAAIVWKLDSSHRHYKAVHTQVNPVSSFWISCWYVVWTILKKVRNPCRVVNCGFHLDLLFWALTSASAASLRHLRITSPILACPCYPPTEGCARPIVDETIPPAFRPLVSSLHVVIPGFSCPWMQPDNVHLILCNTYPFHSDLRASLDSSRLFVDLRCAGNVLHFCFLIEILEQLLKRWCTSAACLAASSLFWDSFHRYCILVGRSISFRANFFEALLMWGTPVASASWKQPQLIIINNFQEWKSQVECYPTI